MNAVREIIPLEQGNVMHVNRNPDDRLLRQFGGLCAVFFGGMAVYRGITTGSDQWVWVLAVAGATAGLVGFLRPSLLKPVFVGWSIAVFPIGWMVSHLILALMFYLVFTPVGIVLRLLGKDPLQLKKTSVRTYWKSHRSPENMKRYFRQF